MENTGEKKKVGWPKWLVIYILAGLIYGAAQKFVHSTVDQFIVIIIAILGAYSFYRIDKKIHPVKWPALKRALMFLSADFLLFPVLSHPTGFYLCGSDSPFF
jgi:hypothetical protein